MNVVKASQPAVVSIVITRDVPVLEQYFEDAPGAQNPFGGLFGNNSPFTFRVPSVRQKGTEKKEVGGGSGFLVSEDGYIVTNKHVVGQENVEYTVFTNDGKKYETSVVARDPVNDIAILKISGSNFPHLQFDSKLAVVGQSVVAIGNALGEFRNTVSVGVVSGLSRSIVAADGAGQPEKLDEVIQTDAAINPGNSGGPLLGLNGRVIGVNVAVALGSQNVGFALPADTVAGAVEQVKNGGKISRAFLGVRYTPVTPGVKESNKLTVDYGVLVVRGEATTDLAVIPGSPADKAGLKEGDVILEVDGKKLEEDVSLASLIAKKKIGDSLQLKVLSSGKEKNITVTLEELK
ncbi:MAG: trypsin-like peptidase domain-containing protein [Candidatus Andersenbacteria bacterium]|nr:trypsin-like peptidase domain-containing protein [Candidatus Andersenbacteria bacterium]